MLSPKGPDETFFLFYFFMRHSDKTPCYPSPGVPRAVLVFGGLFCFGFLPAAYLNLIKVITAPYKLRSS